MTVPSISILGCGKRWKDACGFDAVAKDTNTFVGISTNSLTKLGFIFSAMSLYIMVGHLLGPYSLFRSLYLLLQPCSEPSYSAAAPSLTQCTKDSDITLPPRSSKIN